MPAKKKSTGKPAKRPAKRRTAIPALIPRTSRKPAKMRLAVPNAVPIPVPVAVSIVVPEPDVVEPPYDLIAQRAYEIWATKLRLANDALRNWLEAEQQVRAELNNGEV